MTTAADDQYRVRTSAMWADDQCAIRSVADGDGMTLTGYAAVFGVPSKPLRFPQLNRGKPFREVIEPGAFNRTLNSGRDVVLLWQHDPLQLPYASTAGGTMTLTPDAVGLAFRASLPDNEHGRPMRDAYARRDVRGMSFRMPQVVDNARSDGTFPVEALPDGTVAHVRRVREVKLMPEISMTNMPAYLETTASIRSAAEEIGVDADALESALSAFEAGVLSHAQRDVIIDAATKRAAAATACCDACGDAAPGCCSDQSCPPDCEACDICDTTIAAAPAPDPAPVVEVEITVNTTRSDPSGLAIKRSALNGIR